MDPKGSYLKVNVRTDETAKICLVSLGDLFN